LTAVADLPITRPVFDEHDAELLLAPLRSGWVVQGPQVRAFEARFADFTGAPHAIAVSSCTTGLLLACDALGAGAGDEVLVPAFTWISTATALVHLGAKPVFVDIDLDTFNMHVSAAEAALTPHTVGMVPVHLFGLAADLEPLEALRARAGLWMVEDAACGFDARYRGRHVGTFGNAGAFSFHPRKAITTGEGGMIITADATLAATCRALREHGAVHSDHARHAGAGAFQLAEYPHLGYNARMTDLQGALGCSQMAKADRIQAARRQVAAWYDVLLADVPWLQRPARPAESEHAFQSYVCLFRPEAPSLARTPAMHTQRNAIMATLEQQGIATRQGTHAPPYTQWFQARTAAPPDAWPNAWMAERLTLTLPVFAGMTEDDCVRVRDALVAAFAATYRTPAHAVR
jgi:dTDP-4-amino-4,6-dideoxygalactose transaminase